MVRRCIGYLTVLGLLFALAACGLKGPLYLPDDSGTAQTDNDHDD